MPLPSPVLACIASVALAAGSTAASTAASAAAWATGGEAPLGGDVEVGRGPERPAAPAFTLPLRVPGAELQRLLRAELAERRLLKDFQVVTSKFSNGRVLLDDLKVSPGPRPGTARLAAYGRLRFDRKQLGVKWRGLKSHKKWFQKGAKDVARARVTCVIELRDVPQPAGKTKRKGPVVGISFTSIRVKLESRLSPARGLTVRFDSKPRSVEWTPSFGAIAGLRFRSARIAAVEADAIRLAIEIARRG